MNARNPFKMHDQLNYDQDSEEEWNDLNGENLSEE